MKFNIDEFRRLAFSSDPKDREKAAKMEKPPLRFVQVAQEEIQKATDEFFKALSFENFSKKT